MQCLHYNAQYSFYRRTSIFYKLMLMPKSKEDSTIDFSSAGNLDKLHSQDDKYGF